MSPRQRHINRKQLPANVYKTVRKKPKKRAKHSQRTHEPTQQMYYHTLRPGRLGEDRWSPKTGGHQSAL